jgi:capsular polysaccharide export protein
MASRHFLFLQGLRSPFFMRLAQALRIEGQSVSKIQYTVGDTLYWTGASKGCHVRREHLHDFYQQIFTQLIPTDIVLFGDCRPVHVPAIALASSLGIQVHIFEEGYFRPDWITLETTGVNGYSLLPMQSVWYRTAARILHDAPPPAALPSSLKARVLHDIAYNLGCIANPIFYPNYPTHVTDTIHEEYVAYAKRVMRVRNTRAKDNEKVQSLITSEKYFLLALQVRGDAQLRFHSDYADSEMLLREVLSSFAKHAPADVRLVVKNHPLDPGFMDYGDCIVKLASKFEISERVDYLETGHLPTLLDHAQGLVTVNSTTIGQALFHRCPVKALGRSIFAVDGLLCQESLDIFWRQPGQVDIVLFNDFKKVVTHLTQVNGGLYSAEGIALAIKNAIPRLLESPSRLAMLMDIVQPVAPSARVEAHA